MRVRGCIVALMCLAAGNSSTLQTQQTDAAKVLAAAREALGGEKRLASVQTFVTTGRTRQVRGENLVPIEFEIMCELPDKFIRTDDIPAQESGPTTIGFNGGELIQLPQSAAPVPPGRAGSAPSAAQMEAARNARFVTVKQDFARLMLGMFATSFPAYPLTFTYAGTAEAPQGKADVLDVKGPANFSARLFVHGETHLPVMVSWVQQGPAGPGRIGGPRLMEPGQSPSPGQSTPPGQPAPPGQSPQAAQTPSPAAPAAAQAKPVELRVYYGDYRDVSGIQWPFRIRRAAGPDTVEETTFDRFKINPKLDPAKFAVKK